MKRIILIIIIFWAMFSIKSTFGDGTLPCRQVWSVQIGEGRYLTPAVVDDVNGDGDKEIIVVENGQDDKNVYMLNKQGYILSGWPVSISNNGMSIIKTPAVGNVDDTNNKEIIAICEEPMSVEPDPDNLLPRGYKLMITAIDADGRILTERSSQMQNVVDVANPVFQMQNVVRVTNPVLADMNNDGDMEIILGTVSVLGTKGSDTPNGGLFWQVKISIYVLNFFKSRESITTDLHNSIRVESVFSVETEIISTKPVDIISPIAVGDITGDSAPEIVFSIQEETAYALSYKDKNNDGMMDLLPGWPLEGGTPVLVDLDRDGVKEIILADYLRVYNGDATEMAGYNSYNDSMIFGKINFGPPAVGDVDNDGEIEIVAEGKLIGGYGGSGGGFPSIQIYVLNSDGTLKTRLDDGPDSYYLNQDILADLNNDGKQEIISYGKVYFNMLYDGQYHEQASESINLDYTGRANVATVSSMFEDGSLSLIVTTERGYIYVYDFSPMYIGNRINPRADWPAFRHDSRNSGASELTVRNRIISPPIIKIKLNPNKRFYNAGEKIKVSIAVSSEAGIDKILVDNSYFIGSVKVNNKVNTIRTTGRKGFVYSQNIVLRKSEIRKIKIQAYDVLYSLFPNEAHSSSKQVQLTCRPNR